MAGYPSEFRPLQLCTTPTVWELVCASTPLMTSMRSWYFSKNAALFANGAYAMLPASRISSRSAQWLMTGSPGVFAFGSQKLVGSQPPSACTNTNSLPR